MTDFRQADHGRRRISPARQVQDDIRALEETIDDAIAGGGELIGRMMRVGQARRHLSAMPPLAREVFLLCVEDRVPLGTVAARLGISRDEAKAHLRHAIRQMMD